MLTLEQKKIVHHPVTPRVGPGPLDLECSVLTTQPQTLVSGFRVQRADHPATNSQFLRLIPFCSAPTTFSHCSLTRVIILQLKVT